MADLIIIGIILVSLFLALKYIIKTKKNGGSCSGCCSGCSQVGTCNKKQDDETKANK